MDGKTKPSLVGCDYSLHDYCLYWLAGYSLLAARDIRGSVPSPVTVGKTEVKTVIDDHIPENISTTKDDSSIVEVDSNLPLNAIVKSEVIEESAQIENASHPPVSIDVTSSVENEPQ